MSSHADTIRDYTTNTERYDGQWHRLPTEQEVLAALDALLAENQRLEADDYRLRTALILLADNAEAYLDLEQDGARNYPDSLRLCVKQAREALAGEDE